ncbi:MAG: glycosyltransferase family 2 protein [Gammaproteobacteria bacterium]|nr:glycosyltransferase family 2 protein [Gammaproteobacteria bacterium]
MKISIITPSYQQGAYILRTLQSVAIQNISVDLEHIVMDGGSKDQTVDILKTAAQTMPHINWTSEPDNGQAHAVNKGIEASRGDIIGWINSDDIYYHGALQTVLDYFETHPDTDVVYGEADHIDVHNTPFESYPTEPWNPKRLPEVCFISQPALFFRRRVFEKHGLLDASLQYCMDYEYWLRLSQSDASVAFLPKKLAGSRLYPEAKTLHARIKAHAEINDMIKNKLGNIPHTWIYNYAHAVVEEKLNREENPALFIKKLSLQTIISSLYWNKKIPISVLKQVSGWLYSTSWHWKKNDSTVNQCSEKTQLELLSSEGAYPREQNEHHWWQWVNQKVVYEFSPSSISTQDHQSHIEFGYRLCNPQTLTIDVFSEQSECISFTIPSSEALAGVFSEHLAIPLRTISSISISSDRQSTPLSIADTRVASWRILDFDLH